jgi:hypothetical protein
MLPYQQEIQAMKLTKAQRQVITNLSNSNQPMIGFAADPTIKRLLTLGIITFDPTAFGAGYIALKRQF